MTATVTVTAAYGTAKKKAGSPQAVGVLFQINDSAGNKITADKMEALDGVAATNSMTFTGVPSGSGYIASAYMYDSQGQPTAPIASSAPFAALDDVEITVVTGVSIS